MFAELRHMVDFISMAPWFIFGGFAGSFLLVFGSIKLAQSDVIYGWFEGKMDEWRANQTAKIRRAIMRDATEFRGNRKVDEMSDIEQKLYFQMLESGYERIEHLYKTGGDTNEQSRQG